MTEFELRVIVRTNIRRFRKSRKWTQAQLAEKLNISINFLSDIENGKKWISPAKIVKFAAALNIEPFELFKPAEAPPAAAIEFFSRYNDAVIQAVSDSLRQIHLYFQELIEEEPYANAKDAVIPERSDDDIYSGPSRNGNRGLVAETER